MKAITKYQADDGTEFKTESLCAAHEALCAEVAAVLARLPATPKDDGCNFANGHGFIQHDAETFAAVRRDLLLIAKRVCPHRWVDESLADPTVHASWASRIIGESSTPLWRGWLRIGNTDKQLREWGQPYYAANPEQGERVCLNPAA